MKILLTGGRGLLGKPLAKRLEADHETVVTDVEDLDVTDRDALARAFHESEPGHVIHLAAWTDVDGCERDPERADHVNATGTRNVAEQCARLGVPLLYVSTDYVFDGRSAEPYREDDPPNPLSAYGRSKLAGEAAVRDLAPEWRIVRCQSIYGLGKKSFVDAVIARARAGDPVRVVTDQRVTPSYAEDVADALVAVVSLAGPGVYHASNAGSCTWYECAAAAFEISRLHEVDIAPITSAELARPAPRPAYSVFDCSRLAESTGHVLRTWRAALGAYLASRASERGAA